VRGLRHQAVQPLPCLGATMSLMWSNYLGRSLVQRGWLQVALAAVAGLGSLAVCSGAVAVIVLLFIASIQFGWVGSSLDPPLFWLGVSAAILFAGVSLSLPPLALGARGRHALKTTVLSSLCFCTFVFVAFLIVVTHSFLVPLISLMALVGTSVVGSLVAVQDEEDQIAIPMHRATLIAALAIYCASLFTFWLVFDESNWQSYFVPMVVAASSWPVLPGIVAKLRSG
jgi:hypothetical protein